MAANPDDHDETLIQIIGRALDKPSVYMGGASRNSSRRAAEVLDALWNYGYKIEVVQCQGEPNDRGNRYDEGCRCLDCCLRYSC